LLTLVLAAAPISLAPLSPEEKVEFNGPPCRPFQEAVKAALDRNPGGRAPEEKQAALQAALTRPASADEAMWARCLSLYERGMADFRAATIEAEAKVTLKSLALGMKMAFDDKKKLCPSTKNPVPADLRLLESGPWKSTSASWTDPTWACLAYTPPPQQRFQYEVKTDAKAKTFELLARGYPRTDGSLSVWSLTGKVNGASLEVGEPTKK
jgi:hypothetical protein